MSSTPTRGNTDAQNPTRSNGYVAARDDESFDNSSSSRNGAGKPGCPDNAEALPTTPSLLPAVAEEEKEGEEKEDPPRSQFKGLFPGAGGPLPPEVLESLFAWLRATDLAALCASSRESASPGETKH